MKTLLETLRKQSETDAISRQTARITALKEMLTATDYKVIKCAEFNLAGLEPPYDIAVVHAERQALRDEINTLEAEIENIRE